MSYWKIFIWMLTLFLLKILIKIGQLEIFLFKLMGLITYTMKQNTKPKIKVTIILKINFLSFNANDSKKLKKYFLQGKVTVQMV